MIKLALYLAFGFAFLVIFEGAHIDPANGWTWVWIFAWPVPILLFIAKWFLILVVALLVVSVGIIVWESWR